MKKSSRPYFQQDVCVSNQPSSSSQISEDKKLMPASGRATFRGGKPNCSLREEQ